MQLPAPTVESPRRSLGAAALLLTGILWIPNFGLIDLVDGFTGFVDQSRNQVLDAGWGALFGILLPLGLLAQLGRPQRRIAGVQQAAVVAAAIALAAFASGEWRYLELVALLAGGLAIVLSLHPARREFLHRTGSAKPAIALTGFLAAAPCLVYAARMSSAERRHLPPADAVSNGLHHWTAMGALPLAALLLIVLAAAGTNGWRIPAWSAALAAAAWGASSLSSSDPRLAGSEGRSWACAAVGWGAAVGVAALIEARRESGSPQPSTPLPHTDRRPRGPGFATLSMRKAEDRKGAGG